MDGAAGRLRYMSVETVMTKDVITVKASEKIACVWLLLMEKDVSGAPVVDDAGLFVGVLSVTDINRAIMDRAKKAGAVHEASCESSGDAEAQRQRIRFLGEAMRAVSDSPVSTIIPASQTPFTLGPNDSLDRAIKLMAEHSVNRLPVVKEGRVVGVISRQDVIWLYAGRPRHA